MNDALVRLFRKVEAGKSMSSRKDLSNAVLNIGVSQLECASAPKILVQTEDGLHLANNSNVKTRNSEISGETSSEFRPVRQKLYAVIAQKFAARMKLVKITGLAVLTYVVCWGPYQGLGLADIICIMRHGDQSPDCNATIQWYWLQGLIMLNACLNPIIYQFNTRKQHSAQSSMSLKVGRQNRRGAVTMEPRHRRHMDEQC